VQWFASRGGDYYLNEYTIGGTETCTFLAYANNVDVTIEALDPTGASLWTHVNPASLDSGLVGIVDRAGQWVVVRRSPVTATSIETTAYSPTGQQTLLHTQPVGTFGKVSVIAQDGDGYVVGYEGLGGIYRFTGPLTNWHTRFTNFTTFDRLDINGSEIVALGTYVTVSNIKVLSSQTGAIVRSRSLGGRVYGMGPTPTGEYAYVNDTYAVYLNQSGNVLWARALGLGATGRARLGYLSPTGRYIIAAQTKIGEDTVERDIQVERSSGQVLSFENVVVRGGQNLAMALAPRQDGSTALLDTSGNGLFGGGFRIISADGIASNEIAFDNLPISSSTTDSEGNFIAVFGLGGNRSIRKLDASGAAIYAIESPITQVVAGRQGAVFGIIGGTQGGLVKLDRRGREVWRTAITNPYYNQVTDGGSAGVSIWRQTSTSGYATTWLDANGNVTLDRPGLFNVAFRSDGTYYTASQSNEVFPTVEYRDARHRLIWSRQIPGEPGQASVRKCLADRDGNVVVVHIIAPYRWGAASYDKQGVLRWAKRFEGENYGEGMLLRGKDLIVVGHLPVNASRIEELAYRIVPNQPGGTDHRELAGRPLNEDISFVTTDFAGNAFVGGMGRLSGRRALVWRIGATGSMAQITALNVIEGTRLQGGLPELTVSDDSKVAFASAALSNTVTVEVQAHLPSVDESELDGMVEHSCDRPGMAIELRLLPIATGNWTFVGSGTSDDLDSRISFWRPLPATSGTGRDISLRAEWGPIHDEDPAVDAWHCTLDLIGLHQSPIN
jgi:hypothetical protein